MSDRTFQFFPPTYCTKIIRPCQPSAKTSHSSIMPRPPHYRIFGVIKIELALLQMSVEAFTRRESFNYCSPNELPYRLQNFERNFHEMVSLLVCKKVDNRFLEEELSKACATSGKICSKCNCSKCKNHSKVYRQTLDEITVIVRIKNCLLTLVIVLQLISILLNFNRTPVHS